MVLYNLSMNELNISVGTIVSIVITLFSFVGAVVGFSKYFKNIIKNIMAESLQHIEEKIDENSTKIDKVTMDNCKNYIVDFLARAEHGEELSNDALLRFSENYQLYVDRGGNSYIHNWVERLKAEGKLDHKPMV